MSNGPNMDGLAFPSGIGAGLIIGFMIGMGTMIGYGENILRSDRKQAMELGHGQYETNSDGATSWHWKGELK